MTPSPRSPVIDPLRRALLLRDGAGLTDGQLLEAFVREKDEAAFAALVCRHGPMVLGVCRRVLRNHHDAEDAFQAAFLVLARKAESIAPRDRVAGWLYGVAYRTALKARAMCTRHSVRERQVADMPEPPAVEPQSAWSDLQLALDQELSRLPARYRDPVILCDLEGKSGKEAARQLGCPEGTVASRLARGRALLRGRLARHGLTVASGSLAVLLSQQAAPASIPTALILSTGKAAARLAAGESAAGVVSDRVAALTEGVMKAMFATHVKRMAVIVLLAAAGLCAAGGGLLFRAQAQAPQPAQEAKEGKSAPEAKNGPAWQERATLKGHSGAVSAVAISPDGRLLASASHDKTIKLWDMASGRLRATLAGHTDRVFSVAFAPDGKTLASASADGTVMIWHAATGKTLAKLAAHAGWVWSVAFSPDGRTLASASNDKTIKLWDIASGKELATLEGHKGIPGALAFSPDGKTLASAGTSDHSVRLWDRATGKEVARLEHAHINPGSVAFSPDGRTLASAGTHFEKKEKATELTGVITLWNVATGKEQAILRSDAGDACVAFSPDGRLLASGHASSGKRTVAEGKTRIEGDTDGVVKLWEVRGVKGQE